LLGTGHTAEGQGGFLEMAKVIFFTGVGTRIGYCADGLPTG
jgi:hypothetical protein